jgi:outer membrane protein assembly factor BamB
MSMNPRDEPAPRTPLRLWPGVLAAVLLLLVRFALPAVAPDAAIYGMLGGLLCAVAIVVWWLLFSRAPWFERVGALVLMVLALLGTSRLVHESIANGMMGMMLPFYATPILSLALVAWALASRGLSGRRRYALMVAAVVLASSVFTLIRTGGISGAGESDLHWRWTETPEERLLAQEQERPAALTRAPSRTADEPRPTEADRNATAPAAPVPAVTSGPAPAEPGKDSVRAEGTGASATAAAEWPGFRGPNRDGAIGGVRIQTDWTASPPIELWRRPVGPGWSSFSVHADLVYTQEQRGEDEVVSCYRLATGEPVWKHRDAVRFWESNGGAGPRATPTVHGGRVYSVGATGILNALDAATGTVIWSHDALADTGQTIPGWGIASSPLVIGDAVVAGIAGRLVAYEVSTGNLRWLGPEGGGGYSSPHLATIDGVPQVLLLRGSRTISVAPADGTLLWDHTWEAGVSIVQPGVTADGDVLVVAGDAMGGTGIRRIAAARRGEGWTVEERWTSRALKPYFNDFVVHEGHAYGFDGSILAAIDLADGTRRWKGGRYGHGQMILLADQDLLLVLSEEGELALVRAVPDEFTDIARFAALDGKTWNHPVLAGDILLVRNGEEMAAFRLALADRPEPSTSPAPRQP